MPAFFTHCFVNAETYAAILAWVVAPLTFVVGYLMCLKYHRKEITRQFSPGGKRSHGIH